jgi:hypothetical protein
VAGGGPGTRCDEGGGRRTSEVRATHGQGEGSRTHRRRRTMVGRRWGGAAAASVIGQASMEGGD